LLHGFEANYFQKTKTKERVVEKIRVASEETEARTARSVARD
jgi:hypothetical protein